MRPLTDAEVSSLRSQLLDSQALASKLRVVARGAIGDAVGAAVSAVGASSSSSSSSSTAASAAAAAAAAVRSPTQSPSRPGEPGYADSHFRRLQMELRCAEVEIGVLNRQLQLAKSELESERSRFKAAVSELEVRVETEAAERYRVIDAMDQLQTETVALRALSREQVRRIAAADVAAAMGLSASVFVRLSVSLR